MTLSASDRNGLEARATQGVPLPAPRVDVQVRPATLDDFDFIDALQTAFCKQLGYMPRAQLQSKLASGHVLVAEHNGVAVGYVIGTDRYFKRDDCGIIYQLCVADGQRRGLIGAMLVKAMFDRAAYGCRLFCCWCAQDIEANRFWESLGFVPLAFRAGSEKKGKRGMPRVHIFWQKRIRPGDTTTPWWFPAKTDSGSIREDRLVLPIPPQLHWSDPMPVLTPEATKTLPDEGSKSQRHHGAKAKQTLVPGMVASPRAPTPNPRKRPYIVFGPPPAMPTPAPEPTLTATIADDRVTSPAGGKGVEEPKPRRQKRKADPKLITAARELRDRWLEAVESQPDLLLPQGKYDLARALPESGPLPHGRGSLPEIEVKALPAAA